MTNNRPENTSIKHVLVIDDNKDITEMLEDFFKSEDIECRVINEALKGLNEIRKSKGRYDIILLDLTMPDISGWDIFEILKEENILKSENIIIFTASTKTNNEINQMIDEGAKYILRKPFSLDELIKVVEKFSNNIN